MENMHGSLGTSWLKSLLVFLTLQLHNGHTKTTDFIDPHIIDMNQKPFAQNNPAKHLEDEQKQLNK